MNRLSKEEILWIEKRAKSNAAKILKSLSQGSLDPPPDKVSATYWPDRVLLAYLGLKNKIISTLGIGEITKENSNKILTSVVKRLKKTYNHVGEGRRAFKRDNGYSGDAVPVAFYLDYPVAFFLDYYEEKVLKEDPPRNFYKGYFLIAMVALERFETQHLISYGKPNELDNPEKKADLYRKSLDCLGMLIIAQSAVELGNASLERSLGDHGISQRQSILDQYPGAIQARKGINKANAEKSADAIKKWLPLIKEVHSEIESKGKKINDACRHVVKRHNDENWGTLKNNYHKWKKNLSKFESV